MLFEEELNGNWEEKGVIGSRIEIHDDNIIFLWRSGEVLSTTFSAEQTANGVIELHLSQNGLRYAGSDTDYATVERLYYEGGRPHYSKQFPFSGISEEILTPTDKSRYGYVTINDDLLANVQGTWEDTFTGSQTFTIIGDEMTLDGRTFRIHAAINRYKNRGEDFSIIHQNPAIHEIGYFTEMICQDGAIKGYILVCDAGVHEVVFRPSVMS